MKSLFSWVRPPKRTRASALHIRLYLARFRHLLRQYGQIIALCEDAADKQSGQYIFDKAYIMSLIDRAFEAAEGMTYDLNTLSGERYLSLYKDLESLRNQATERLKDGSFSSPPKNNEEEPEYFLLRGVQEILCRAESPTPSLRDGLSGPNFFGVLQFLLQTASDLIVELAKSSGVLKPLNENPSAPPFPIDAYIADLMHTPSLSHGAAPRAQTVSENSIAAREFLSSFFSPAIWRDNLSFWAGRKSESLVGYHLAGSMNVTIVHGGGYDLFDVSLSRVPASNYVYCRFPQDPVFSLAKEGLERLGFFVSSSEHGLAGWIDSQPLSETIVKLKAAAKISAFLLQPSTAAARQTEEDMIRLLGMQD